MKAWHDEAASALLFLVGILLLIAGLFLDRTEAVSITLLILGAGVIATGAFLPRIEGLLTIGARGVRIPVAASTALAEPLLRFERVRETAEKALEAAPRTEEREEKVAEAVGRAFLDLFPTPSAVTASVAGSAVAPVWPASPSYSGGAAALPPQPVSVVPAEEYFRFLKRLEEPSEQFVHRIISLEGISFEAAPASDVQNTDEKDDET